MLADNIVCNCQRVQDASLCQKTPRMRPHAQYRDTCKSFRKRDIDIHVFNIEDKRLYNSLYYILALLRRECSGSRSMVRQKERRK